MKIIKQGKELNTKIGRKFYCTKCGCKYIAKPSEYKMQPDINGDFYYFSQCPDCNSYVFCKVNLE